MADFVARNSRILEFPQHQLFVAAERHDLLLNFSKHKPTFA